MITCGPHVFDHNFNEAGRDMDSIIEIEDLRFCYHADRYVLDGISLAVAPGESVGVIGANGVGKSTFLKILAGLLPEYEGSIRIADHLLEKKNYGEIRRRLGYVFQDSDSQLFMNTVEEDVAFGPLNYGFSREEADRSVKEALRKTHMEGLAGRHIYRLSGGEKKLAAIAGILALQQDDGVILMDEPSVSLDPANRENLIEVIRELKAAKLLASHDLDFIYDTCERTILLSGGEVVYDGDTKRLLRDKTLLEENGLRLPLSFRFPGNI